MNTRLALVIGGLLTLAASAYSAVMWTRLPEIVPVHWNVHGQADGYGSKATSLLMMLGVMVLLNVLLLALPAMSPEKFRIESFRNTFNYVMVLTLGLMGALHVSIVQATSTGTISLEKTFGVVMFLFFALIGNVMGKVQRNFWMGVRTPWTLADERVWDRTHRAAARLWTFGGVVGVVLALLGVPGPVLFFLLMGIALWPAVDSYLIYQRLHKDGSTA